MVGLALKRGILSQPLSLAQTVAALGLPVSFSTAGKRQPRSSGSSWGVAAKLPLLVVLLYAELHLRDTTGLQEQLLHLAYGRPNDLGLIETNAAAAQPAEAEAVQHGSCTFLWGSRWTVHLQFSWALQACSSR